jgi:putative ABC transport system permease protein
MRSLLKQPAFTTVAVITLALGIAATTTIFSIINALILTPLSIVEPDRVVAIWKTPQGNHVEGYVSYLDLQDWRAMNKSFTDIAAYKSQGVIMLDQGEAERLSGMRVTANFFPLMKVNPIRGRNFQVEEEKRGAPPVAIISYEFWQNRLGGDEAVLGRQLSLDAQMHTIIGILPPRFEFPISYKGVAIWTTVTGENENLDERGAFVLRGVGRLKPGVTIQQAQADMVNVAANMAQEHPGSNRDTTIFLTSAPEQVVGRDIRRALWLLLGAVGFILLIACTNTANLLMVRASAKEKEIAIRAALGAGRWRIARHLMIESILLSFLAAFVGLLVTVWVLGAIRYYGANQLPRLDEVQIDARVLIFAVGVSMLTALLFSLVPVLKTSRPDINEVLKSGTKAATSNRSLSLWRDLFVVTEVALSLVLLVGAGLMIRSFAQLMNVAPGFDPTNVLIGSITLIQPKYEKPEERLVYVSQTLNRLKALPGVENAAFIAPMPFSGADVGGDFRVVGRPEPEAGREPTAAVRSVSNEYFQALKIPLLKGRYFNEQDRRESVGAAIINQALVQRYFSNEEPVGKRISNIGSNQNEGDPEQWEIVGIIRDVHHNSLTKSAAPEIYLPYQQNPWRWGHFVVRTTDAPAGLMASFREQIRGGDKTVPINSVRILSQAISDTINKPRFYTLLFGLFAGIGLVLTITGIYGVISYTVSQRTQEIGIRMALGATRQNVVRMVLMQGIALAILGVIIGMAISLGFARVMASLLFEVKPIDLSAFGIAVSLLLAAALFAAYVPARRATRVDPLVALRYE